MKIKDFNSFINHNEHVNERYIIEDLDILKYHLKEFKKFLYHETNKISNTGLIIQLSENFDSNDLRVILNKLKIPFFWVDGTEYINENSLFQFFKDGNNQCIVFNDCSPGILEKSDILKNGMSFDNSYDIPSLCELDNPKNHDNVHHSYFRGVVIILTNTSRKTIFDKAPHFDGRFKYIKTK